MSVTQAKKLYEVIYVIHLDRISELMAKLGPRFAERAARAMKDELSWAEISASSTSSSWLQRPKELGGGGASHGELADMLRQLGHYCGSTALAFPMHTHQVATAAWRWRHQKAPVDRLGTAAAAKNIVILSSGGSETGCPRLRHSNPSRWWLSD